MTVITGIHIVNTVVSVSYKITEKTMKRSTLIMEFIFQKLT